MYGHHIGKVLGWFGMFRLSCVSNVHVHVVFGNGDIIQIHKTKQQTLCYYGEFIFSDHEFSLISCSIIEIKKMEPHA